MLLSDVKWDDIEAIFARFPLRRDFSDFDIQKIADAPNPPGWPTYENLWEAMNEKQDIWIAESGGAQVMATLSQISAPHLYALLAKFPNTQFFLLNVTDFPRSKYPKGIPRSIVVQAYGVSLPA
jgi:hypothetical protein